MKLLAILLLSAVCAAQTAKPIKSKALQAAEARAVAAEQRVADLEKENAALNARNTELAMLNVKIKSAAQEVLKNDREFAAEFGKLVAAHADLTNKYNVLIEKANFFAQQAQLATFQSFVRQQQPIQIYTPPARLSVHCTSRDWGFQVTTDCN
jgi:hypothetical protein